MIGDNFGHTCSLTHWGLVMHNLVSELVLCQANTWINADLFSIRSIGINFNEIWIKMDYFLHLKISSAKCQPLWSGLNVLNDILFRKLQQHFTLLWYPMNIINVFKYMRKYSWYTSFHSPFIHSIIPSALVISWPQYIGSHSSVRNPSGSISNEIKKLFVHSCLNNPIILQFWTKHVVHIRDHFV